jgi:hypothetical protein
MTKEIGLRDNRINDRCNVCIKRLATDWCQKYNENIHYCINECIIDHPDCVRDNQEIRQKIRDFGIGR